MKKRKKPKPIVKSLRLENTWAFDLGEHMGWATEGASGVVEVQRLDDMFNFFDNISPEKFPGQNVVVYEDCSHTHLSEASREAYYKRVGVVELWCQLNDVRCESVQVSRWKAWGVKNGVVLPDRPPLPFGLWGKRKLLKDLSREEKTIHNRLKAEHRTECKLRYLERARELFKINIPDDNAGDAAWVLDFYNKNMGVL